MSTMTVTVPLTIRRRGGRKVVIAPEGATWAPPRPRADSMLVKALARAFRWRRMLEEGRYSADSNARRPGIPISSRPAFRPDRGHRSDLIAATPGGGIWGRRSSRRSVFTWHPIHHRN